MKEVTYIYIEGMSETLEKYGEAFTVGQTKQIHDDEFADKLLTCPYFVEANIIEGEVVQEVIEAPKKKRKRRTKAEIEADKANEQN